MASGENTLVGWYRDRVGHPTNRNEVYGYWTFVIGGVVALLGALWIVVRAGAPRGSREFGFVLVMVGAVALLAGGTLRLPLSELGTRLTQAGGVIAVVGVAAFSTVFPQDWNYGSTEIPIVGLVYVAGLAVMVAAPVVAPIVRDGPDPEELADRLSVLARQHDDLTVSHADRVAEAERAQRRAEELDAEAERLETELETIRAERDEAIDETETADERATIAERRLGRIENSQASFELYKDRGDEWRWRLVHQNRNIVATSGEGYSSDRTARRGLRSVKRNALGADVIWLPTEDEPEPTADHVTNEPDATVELFENDGHRWRLRADNGRTLATASRGYASRENAKNGLASARRLVGPAEYLTFDPAGFEVYRDAAGEHRWRLVTANGRIIADSGEGYTSRSDARDAVRTVCRLVDAPIDADERPGFEIVTDAAGEHRWRLVAGNGEIVADSGEGYTERSNARDGVERVQRYAPDADTVSVGEAAVELFEENGKHGWRLRHRNGRLLARPPDRFASRSNAIENLNNVKRSLPNAPIGE